MFQNNFLNLINSIPVKRLRDDPQLQVLYKKLKEVFEAETLGESVLSKID